jgi:predicted acetyltransferase
MNPLRRHLFARVLAPFFKSRPFAAGTDVAPADEARLQLIEPSPEYADDLTAMSKEYLKRGTKHERDRYAIALKDPVGYITRAIEHGEGINLPEGYVRQKTFWLVRDDGRIVANSRLRLELTPFLEREGGHIGYSTRPSERRKGYGTVICKLTLQRAKSLGFKKVLITCDEDNVASARIIEKNGGRYENTVLSWESQKPKRRYWVDLA